MGYNYFWYDKLQRIWRRIRKYSKKFDLAGAGMSIIKILMKLNNGNYEFDIAINPDRKETILTIEYEK